MKGDFSRVTFDPRKNFTRVLMQQGRVQLDADWNEQAAILLHYLQSLAADLIGPYGGPEGNVGFEIGLDNTGNKPDLTIGPGKYYVDGLLCENLEPARFREQAYHRLPADRDLPDAPFLVYLDAWERHVTYIQDDGIREVALGGPDTATRAQVVWQVRATRQLPQGDRGGDWPNADQWKQWVREMQPEGGLRARANTDGKPEDLCTASPDAKYRGAENQLYRVEIQSQERNADNKTTSVTFKWSRENGSVTFPIRDIDGTTVTLEHQGRDEATGLKRGDWVEVLDNVIELSGKPGPLRKVEEIDAARGTVTLAGKTEGLPFYEDEKELAEKQPFLRRWDHKESAFKEGDPVKPEGGVLFTFAADKKDAWISLEEGIEIQFQPDGLYREGDYWLIPARTATGGILWPETAGEPDLVPPHGVEHHYAPLVFVGAAGAAANRVELRRAFPVQAVPLNL